MSTLSTALTSVPSVPVGGVLSGNAIADLVASGTLIVKTSFSKGSLQAASYNPRIARDGLITPDGVTVEPDSDGRRPARVVLESGDAAVFSTEEKFVMPDAIVGNITIKNTQATEGLLLLSGLLIDPGYGSDNKRGRPLYMHVANIGKKPIVIKPGDQIARIQFLSLCGRPGPKRQEEWAGWSAQEQPSLGFLTELKALKEKVESTSSQVQYVVVLGFVVLAITLIGVVLATVLGIVAK